MASAPSVVVGTFALALAAGRLLGLPVAPPGIGLPALVSNLSNPLDRLPVLAAIAGPAGAWLVLWAFLSGGVLDRFARNRATRGRGFFGACGAHLPAIVRLEIVALLSYTALLASADRRVPLAVAAAGIVAVNVLTDFARVRIVVEDRRSAIGALLAGARFLRRNLPAAGSLYLLDALLIAAAGALYAVVRGPAIRPDGLLIAIPAAGLLLRHFLKLALLASEIALFQNRLAHASYTAAPVVEWPDSPEAEAITNQTRMMPS